MGLFDLLSPFSWDGLLVVVVVCFCVIFGTCVFIASIGGFAWMFFGDLIEREMEMKKDLTEVRSK